MYKEIRWGEFEVEKIDWRRSPKVHFKDKAKIKSQIDEILNGYNDFVVNKLKNQFSISSEKSNLITSDK